MTPGKTWPCRAARTRSCSTSTAPCWPRGRSTRSRSWRASSQRRSSAAKRRVSDDGLTGAPRARTPRGEGSWSASGTFSSSPPAARSRARSARARPTPIHFCGHIYTTDSCPHPTGLPRIDARGFPLRAKDGKPVDDIGRRSIARAGRWTTRPPAHRPGRPAAPAGAPPPRVPGRSSARVRHARRGWTARGTAAAAAASASSSTAARATAGGSTATARSPATATRAAGSSASSTTTRRCRADPLALGARRGARRPHRRLVAVRLLDDGDDRLRVTPGGPCSLAACATFAIGALAGGVATFGGLALLGAALPGLRDDRGGGHGRRRGVRRRDRRGARRPGRAAGSAAGAGALASHAAAAGRRVWVRRAARARVRDVRAHAGVLGAGRDRSRPRRRAARLCRRRRLRPRPRAADRPRRAVRPRLDRRRQHRPAGDAAGHAAQPSASPTRSRSAAARPSS